MATTLDEKSRLSIPGSVAAALLFAWLLYLTRSVECLKTDVAVIREHVAPRSAPADTASNGGPGAPDSSMAKHSR